MTAPPPLARLAVALALTVLHLDAAGAAAQDLPRGTIVDSVACADDPAETYALYLPSDYSPDRAWSLLLAFHPGARGRAMVETYRAAAERYGFVVAASNTSRNGPWEVSSRAVKAMSKDVGRRFAIDAARLYLTGHSGGARVAMEVAVGNRDVAGVIASSAGFGDARPRRSVPFVVYATAGLDDFNYREMRGVDAALQSPHALAVFDGGHTLPPAEVAMAAIEWLELQAIRSKRRSPDAALVERWFAARRLEANAASDAVTRLRLLRAVVADFDGLRDVAAVKAAVTALERDDAVKRAVADDRALLAGEERLLNAALDVEARLADPAARAASLARLGAMLADWSKAAHAAAASPERSRARRLLAGLAAGAGRRADDADYRALLDRHRWRG
jgi:poly(3-hydroxybutyrate) depolymerase